ncbi:hypothetical protein ACHAQH_002757 [Verticillium albo-atrum]
MSEFLGSRISLISKSDIRYVGVLHEINSDESTVSLENVKSFGTEGRKSRPEEEIAPSDQVYEYIIFRGSDVKDLRIEDHPGIKENKPPAMPEDPAIVGSRPRPGGQNQNNQPPPGPQAPGPQGFGQHPYPNNFYPPPGPWGPSGGRGGPGGPGPAGGPMGNMPYPPPPGWFPPGPPGQGFPGGPPPPGWNNYNNFPPGQPMPPGMGPDQAGPGRGQAPGQQGPPGGPGAQEHKPGALGKPAQGSSPSTPTPQPPTGPKSIPQQQQQQQLGKQTVPAPTPPVESKPSVEQVKSAAASLDEAATAKTNKPVPTGPRNNRVTPVVPLTGPKPSGPVLREASAAAQVNTKAAAPTSAASLRDATQAAKAAVAIAMANLNNPAGAQAQAQAQPTSNGNAMDNLTNRVNEMRVNAARGGPAHQGGQGGRGRNARGGRQGQPKVEVPDADFDFAQSNAKFNRDDLVKEAIAGDLPSAETPADGPTIEAPSEAVGAAPTAYNKTTSFFDNISSEAKERADSNGQKPGGREWRGEEQRKNMETFGQGSVDGGYRGYRGRGRGRGRGFGGRGRGGGGGYHGRGGVNGSSAPAI